jgi:hypothetical protein
MIPVIYPVKVGIYSRPLTFKGPVWRDMLR